MDMTCTLRTGVTLGVVTFLAAACNFPQGGTPTVSGHGLVLTYAAQTVQARLTQAPTGLLGTFTPGPPGLTSTPPAATPEVPGTGSPVPGATQTQAFCDRGGFEKDITIPDGTVLDPGELFTKTWQLRNTGACAWNSSYAVVFQEGDSLGGPPAVPLTSGTVLPGETVDVSVNLQAPHEPGTYQGYWMLRNPAGQVFGLGSQADKNFWVKIQVGTGSPIVYDFNIQAKAATWVGSGGGVGDTYLAFGGADDDPNGVAKLKDDFILENGRRSGVALVTGPRHAADGRITGVFPQFTIQDGDRFKAKLGFMENCGGGQVVFQFGIKETDAVQILAEWKKSCDGTLLLPELDLSGYKGRVAQFVLVVLADGSPEDDLVVWGSARIERTD